MTPSTPSERSSSGGSWRANLLLLAVTSALCLGMLETLGQWLRPALPPRALFFSENPWRYDARGFLSFQPSRGIRTAAAYGAALEYDVTFRTNAQGFIDDRDYGPGGDALHRVAVVGDSFTAGYHGGEAWVPQLRRSPGFDPARHRLFNFGVSGTGLPNFRGLLEAFGDPLAIDQILVVAIANDFERPLIRSDARPDGVTLCEVAWSQERCSALPAQIFLFPQSASREQLLEIAATRWAERSGNWLRRFRDRSFLLRGLRTLRKGPRPDREPGFADLRAIRERFPDAEIAVLQLPEKQNALGAEYQPLRPRIEAMGIAYHDGAELCGLTGDDFLPRDSHPAASGYAKIRRCAAGVLGW